MLCIFDLAITDKEVYLNQCGGEDRLRIGVNGIRIRRIFSLFYFSPIITGGVKILYHPDNGVNLQ